MKFSAVVSAATEPMVVCMILAFVAGIRTGLSGFGLWSYVAYLLLIFAAVGFARLNFMKSMRTNWDVSNRRKRVRLLILLVAFALVFFVSLLLWKNIALSRWSGFLFLWLLGFFFITLRVKISGHIAVLTLAIGNFIIWYGTPMWFLIALLPLVGWSRLVLKRHTPTEIVGGFLYSALFILLGLV